MINYLSPLISILLIVSFIVDRLFRLRSIKEYKEAKEAQLDNLKQQLNAERSNNDVQITEMHKKRYDSIKIILDERELQINNYEASLLELQLVINEKHDLSKLLIKELNSVEKSKHSLETEKKALLHQLESVK